MLNWQVLPNNNTLCEVCCSKIAVGYFKHPEWKTCKG